MPDVNITNDCLELIRSKALRGLRGNGQRMSDGTWMVHLGDDTIERIMSYRLDGESISDTIIRVLSGKPN